MGTTVGVVLVAAVIIFLLVRLDAATRENRLLRQAWAKVHPDCEAKLGRLLGQLRSWDVYATRRGNARKAGDYDQERLNDDLVAITEGEIDSAAEELRWQ